MKNDMGSNMADSQTKLGSKPKDTKSVTFDEAMNALIGFAHKGELPVDSITALIKLNMVSQQAKAEAVRQQLIDTEACLVRSLMIKPRAKQDTYRFISSKLTPYRGKTYFRVDVQVSDLVATSPEASND